jgi:hypothetical protein
MAGAERAGRARQVAAKAGVRSSREAGALCAVQTGLGFNFFTDTRCFGPCQGMAHAILRHIGPSAHASSRGIYCRISCSEN